MKDKNTKENKKPGRRQRARDPFKKSRMRYYARLSASLAAVLVIIAAGMFLYLRHESQGYRNEYTEELIASMESSKDLCLEVLEEMDAEPETIANINTQYENAMLEDDIFQQYYLIDGIIDYSLTSLYSLINSKHQQVSLNGGQWINYDDEIEKLIEAQTDMKAIKEQLSNIDLTEYY
ncbi:MAG: hypothetical protein LUG66_03340 [Clostridiales bacterium]|nr:hypothetical protein [Clostridiales bacterium]